MAATSDASRASGAPGRTPAAARTDEPLRVLLVVSELPPVTSGVARSVDELRVGLIERGHVVDAVSAWTEPGLMMGEARLPAGATRFRRYGRMTRGYDVIGLHGPSPLYSDALLARQLLARVGPGRSSRPALVYTHHFTVIVEQAPALCTAYNTVHRRLARIADRCVVTTPSYRDQLLDVGVHDPAVIPWGVDEAMRERIDAAVVTSPRRKRTASDPLRVLFVGQMRPYKGVPVLLDAVSNVDGIELTLAGGGAAASRYHAQAAALDTANARFLGRVPDEALAELYATHDVIVLPSINESEAFGIVLVEGMAAGCVPVATDLPGVRDVVGSAGLLSAPGDAASLRAALVALRDDPDDLRYRSTNARLASQRYTWAAAADAYESVLREAVMKRRGDHG